ncbi:acetoin utilization AcuB family protein [Metasolibacillus sp.]|uniref:acetoin utilization AcuB family protein n=1 Tax=Metasolibacillus sp. TaxID=2703680 RepID=UPI0025CFC377|nr:acetoin utilization AcuB family protein [Metasolibacillus sp.]MCT6925839.1 acetoin utilization AcuB family protein [Metasolibacillus sp.]MCT6941996.1 acetoin utilization AcuB family protein [Metasolibacillus sp.]
MIVEEMMQRNVHALLPTNTVGEAAHLMREHDIRHIPIVNVDNEVIGIITEHDVKYAFPDDVEEQEKATIKNTPLNNIMVKNPIVGHPLDLVEEAALTLYEAKISCLPIVSRNQLVGLITTTDLLYTYIELTGAHKPSSKIDIRVSDKAGVLHDISKIFMHHKVNVLSVLIYPDTGNEENRIVSVRLQIINPLAIIQDLRKAGFDVLWPNVPGIQI